MFHNPKKRRRQRIRRHSDSLQRRFMENQFPRPSFATGVRVKIEPQKQKAAKLAALCLNLVRKLRGGGLCQRCLGLLDEGGEACRVVHGNVGQDFAVELDSGCLEAVDELRVADAVDFSGGIDAHDPERAVLALLLLASAVSELHAALDGFLGGLVELGFCEEVTAGALQNFLAAVVAFGSTFYAGHGAALLF